MTAFDTRFAADGVIGDDVAALQTAIMSFVRGFSIETTPRQAAQIPSFTELLAPGTQVYITFVPDERIDAIVDTAARLLDEGMQPVPHIPARSIASKMMLEIFLRRLGRAGVTQALAIGGGRATPVGVYDSTMQMLTTGLFEANGIERIGVAGHPEGSPDIGASGLIEALSAKNAYAAASGSRLHLVTQFVFDAAPVVDWCGAIRTQGNGLPVRVGIAGPASLRSLVRYARICGVGTSMRMLTRQGGNVLRLAANVTPGRLVRDLASRVGAHDAIDGLHVFPFGGLEKAARWFGAVAAGGFELRASDQDIEIHV